MRHWWMAALVACAACDDGGGDDAVGTGGADGGGLGGAPDAGPPGGCVAGETIVPFAKHDADSVFYGIAVDGDRLWFDTVSKLWTAPRSGGDPQVAYDHQNAMTLPFFPRADHVVVLSSAEDLVSVAKTDFAATPLATLPDGFTVSGTPIGTRGAFVVGDTLYAKHQEGGFDDPPLVRFFALDLGSDAPRELATIDRGENAPFAVNGGAIFMAAREDDGTSTLKRFPVAGGVEVVDIAGAALRFGVVGADDTHVFLNVVGPDLVNGAGVYRVPVGGGAPERLIPGYFPADLVVDVAGTPDRVVISTLQDVWAVPHGGGEATKLFCLPERTRQLHSLAVDGDDVYLGVFDQEARESGIVKVTAP